jgi:L-fuconolactonase
MGHSRITDAHQHFWERSVFDGIEFSSEEEEAIMRQNRLPDDLRPVLESEGVNETVLVADFPLSVSTTMKALELADSHPWIVGVVGWVDLTDPDLGKTLEELTRVPKFKGARHLWENERNPAWIMREDVIGGLKLLALKGLSFDLLARERNWPYIPQVAEAVPDLPLVIDHIGKPNIKHRQYDEWLEMMRQAAVFPNMMVKVSGMITEADWHQWKPSDLQPYVTTAIDIFGVERVMFGSDWPVCLLAGDYGEVLAALRECISGLSESEQAEVLGGSARRFYRID